MSDEEYAVYEYLMVLRLRTRYVPLTGNDGSEAEDVPPVQVKTEKPDRRSYQRYVVKSTSRSVKRFLPHGGT